MMMHKQGAMILLNFHNGIGGGGGILELVLNEFEVDRRGDPSLIRIRRGGFHGFKLVGLVGGLRSDHGRKSPVARELGEPYLPCSKGSLAFGAPSEDSGRPLAGFFCPF